MARIRTAGLAVSAVAAALILSVASPAWAQAQPPPYDVTNHGSHYTTVVIAIGVAVLVFGLALALKLRRSR